MAKDINRGKIIKNHIGEGLKDLGFTYAGYKGGWTFKKPMNKITWEICFRIYRFDEWQFSFELGTDIRGRVPSGHIKGIKSNGDMSGYWRFSDEESMRQMLDEALEVIKKEGIEVLKKLSVPEKISTDREMYYELYTRHDEFAEAFIKRTNLAATEYDDENLKRWFDYIDPRIEEMSKGEYDAAAKRELQEMAAFLGTQLIKYKDAWWNYNESSGACGIMYKKVECSDGTMLDNYINVLSLLVGKYKGNNREWLEYSFYEVIKDWREHLYWTGKDSEYPLFYAVREKRYDACEYLLEQGADAYVISEKEGKSAYDEAVEKGYKDIVELIKRFEK